MIPNAIVIGTDKISPITECPTMHTTRHIKQIPSDHINAILRDFILTRLFRSSSSLILSSLDISADKLRMIIPIPKNRHKIIMMLPLISNPCQMPTISKQYPADRKTTQGENYFYYRFSYCLSSNSLFSFKQHNSSTVTPNT